MFMWRYGTRHPLVLLARELAARERQQRLQAERAAEAAAPPPAAASQPAARPGRLQP